MKQMHENISVVSTTKATAVAVALISIVMVMAAVMFYVQQTASTVAKEWVMHTYQVTGHIQLLFNRLKDVELGQRGYIIAGDEEYLAPYRDALKDSMGEDAKSTGLQQHHSIREELNILRKLVEDNSVQQENLNELEQDINALVDYWQARVRQGKGSGLSKSDFAHENELMDNVRSLISIMMAEENLLLSRRIESDAANTLQTTLVVLSGIAFFYIMMVAAFLLYQKSLREKTLALYQSEERYNLVVRGINVGLWDWNILTGDIYWSPKFLDMLGIADRNSHPSLELFFQRLHMEDREKVNTQLQAHLANKGPYNIEYRLQHQDGHYVWIHAAGQAQWDKHGKPVRMAGSAEDISERVAAAKALEESNSLKAAILSSTQHLIIATDINGQITVFNDAAEKLLGYSASEVVGIKTPAIWHDHEEAVEKARQLSEEYGISIKPGFDVFVYKARLQGSESSEWTFIRKDGSRFPAHLVVTPLVDGQRLIHGYLGVIEDISERKALEQERTNLLGKLTRSNEELERFAYVASHDMQEPLRMIANFSNLILAEYSEKLDDDGKQYVSIVAESATRMQSMIDDLLEYARVGNEGIRFEHINTDNELQQVLANLSTTIDEHKAKVICEHLPNIEGNPIQFMRLLQNLIGNGLKYQPDGVIPVIHVGVEDQGGMWRFHVRDNGIGMEQEYTTRIFEPFKRLHTWQKYKGTGIGLAVCRKIVENHGGKIWATSAPGKGSTFYFTIPKSHEGTL